MAMNSKKTKKKVQYDAKKLYLERENPILSQLLFSLLWFSTSMLLTIPFALMNKNRPYVDSLNVASIVMICISIIWSAFKTYFFEDSLLKYKNYKLKKFSVNYDFKVNENNKITLDEYKKFKKESTWWGPITLGTTGLLIFLVTLTIELT